MPRRRARTRTARPFGSIRQRSRSTRRSARSAVRSAAKNASSSSCQARRCARDPPRRGRRRVPAGPPGRPPAPRPRRSPGAHAPPWPHDTPSRISTSGTGDLDHVAGPRPGRRPFGDPDPPGRAGRQRAQQVPVQPVPPAERVVPRRQRVGREDRRRQGIPRRRGRAASRRRRCSCPTRTDRPPPRAGPRRAAAAGPASTGSRPGPGRPGVRRPDPSWPSERADQASTARRPENARPSVISSAYSRSPPTGSPLASRVTDRSGNVRSSRREVGRGGLALQVRVGGQDDLAHARLRDPGEQRGDAQLIGPDAVDRRDRPAQHVIAAAELPGALDGGDVLGLLDHADHRLVPARVGTDPAAHVARPRCRRPRRTGPRP